MTSPSRKTCIVSWQAWLAGTVAKHVDQNSSEISCNEGTEKKRKSREKSHGTRNYRSFQSCRPFYLEIDFFPRIFMLFFTFSRSFFLSPPPSFSSFRNRLDSHLLFLLSIATWPSDPQFSFDGYVSSVFNHVAVITRGRWTFIGQKICVVREWQIGAPDTIRNGAWIVWEVNCARWSWIYFLFRLSKIDIIAIYNLYFVLRI